MAEKHSWKQTPLSLNLKNQCCKQGMHNQTAKYIHRLQTSRYNQWLQQQYFYYDYSPAKAGMRCCSTSDRKGKIWGVHFRQLHHHHLVGLHTFQSLMNILELWGEPGYTPREGKKKKRESKRDTRVRAKACVKSQQRSEGGPMGATHLSTGLPPPSLLGSAATRGLVAPPWFPPPTVPSSITNRGVWLPPDPPSCSVHEIHSPTHASFTCTKTLSTYRT